MDFSEDEKLLVYSCQTMTARLIDLDNLHGQMHNIYFSDRENSFLYFNQPNSIKLSGDNKEVLAGSSQGELFLHDIDRSRVYMKLDKAHAESVNSVCYLNKKASSNLILTAGEDCLIKLWDKRALSSANRPAGVFVGHLEGITHISSKGDEKFFASNGKDQLLKLWDMRKMIDPEFLAGIEMPRKTGFDFTQHKYPKEERQMKMKED